MLTITSLKNKQTLYTKNHVVFLTHLSSSFSKPRMCFYATSFKSVSESFFSIFIQQLANKRLKVFWNCSVKYYGFARNHFVTTTESWSSFNHEKQKQADTPPVQFVFYHFTFRDPFWRMTILRSMIWIYSVALFSLELSYYLYLIILGVT